MLKCRLISGQRLPSSAVRTRRHRRTPLGGSALFFFQVTATLAVIYIDMKTPNNKKAVKRMVYAYHLSCLSKRGDGKPKPKPKTETRTNTERKMEKREGQEKTKEVNPTPLSLFAKKTSYSLSSKLLTGRVHGIPLRPNPRRMVDQPHGRRSPSSAPERISTGNDAPRIYTTAPQPGVRGNNTPTEKPLAFMTGTCQQDALLPSCPWRIADLVTPGES